MKVNQFMHPNAGDTRFFLTVTNAFDEKKVLLYNI